MENTERQGQNWDRRQFIKRSFLGSLATAVSIPTLKSCDLSINGEGLDWEKIRAQFPISQWEQIQFNSGSAGVMPTSVLEHLLELIRLMNSIPPYEAWRIWAATRQQNLARLAAMLNVVPTEIQLVRNTTEALNMVIYGLPLQAGDQVLYSKLDYPFAINAWKNRAARDGVELIEVDFTLPASDETILAAYRQALTPIVKVIHCTHITHAQGHIMPVAKLARLAHEYDAQIVVDGAHSLGQIAVDLADLDCDYFATSLHKWLNAPHGTGLLFVKEPLIPKLHNHPSSYPTAFAEIGKFEHLGTRAFHQEIGVLAALDFHEIIGVELKLERLQELKNYWTSRVQNLEKVKFYTDLNENASGAIATFYIDEMKTTKILNRLAEDFEIHAKAVGGDWGSGIRISVNVFTSFTDLDQLVHAITTMAME